MKKSTRSVLTGIRYHLSLLMGVACVVVGVLLFLSSWEERFNAGYPASIFAIYYGYHILREAELNRSSSAFRELLREEMGRKKDA